jgi:hypothetical protein
MLSHPLSIVALVSRYLTNKLILRKPLPRWNLTICRTESHPVWIIKYYPQFPVAIPDLGVRYLRDPTPFAAAPLPKESSRSTCMPNPCRQRSF